MEWGYYCRTCGLSSPRFYRDASGPRRDLAVTHAKVAALDSSDGDLSDALDPHHLRVMVWIAPHLEHDLWAECDTGVLRLAPGRPPVGEPFELPAFAR